MIDQIFVDLDDVCNHFTMHALQYMGCDCGIDDSDFPENVGYDIVVACNLLHPVKDWTPSNFWTHLGPNVWFNMPMREDAVDLLDMCADVVGRENVFICTKCTLQPEHYAGKIRWIYDHLPSWIFSQVQINGYKETNARPGALLIDDSDYNIKKFRGTRGGRAILVPRPWNTLGKHNGWVNIKNWVNDELKSFAREIR